MGSTPPALTITASLRLTCLIPSLRIGYRWRDKITFEIEAALEKGETTTSAQTEETSLGFYTLGYRWDF